MNEPPVVDGAAHRRLAIDANNSTFELLDGRSHSSEEADELLQRAYAAAYHWRRADGAAPINQSRAAWLVGRAHAVLGHGDVALHHAERCAALLAEAGEHAADFDRAYAHELRARALACLGRLDEAGDEYDRAAAVEIADADDREIVQADLAAPPWYGLDRP